MVKQLKSSASGMICKLSLWVAMVCVGSITAWAQVTGTVVDTNDDPLPGVTVLIKGSGQGVSTNIDGEYTIDAPANATLIFRYVGMMEQNVKVDGRKVINVVMQNNDATLDEVVVVGYGQQKRGTITGAVSSVSGTELLNAPTMSVSNLVGSRVAGIASKQTSGQPGSDNATLYLRGQSGIIYVIDGVKRTSEDFNQLDPNDIDQVSILKDAASVAIYGLDANGVIIVTTKRGKTDEKTTIKYTGSVGLSQNAEEQQWLDGPGYAYWFNRGLEMDGLQPIFTQEHVRKMQLGIDGWGNTNWYKKVFGTGFRTSHNVSVEGGSEKVKFFASISYLKEDGNVDNFSFNRWNVRSNLDANIGYGLKFSLGVSGRLQKQDNPYYSANPDAYANVGAQMVRQLPYLPETVEYNGKSYYTGNISNGWNGSVLASINDNGYTRYDYNNFQTTMSLQWDTPFLKGLSAKFTAAYDANFNFSKQLNNPATIMLYKNGAASFVAPDVLEYSVYKNGNGGNISLVEGASKNHTLTTLTTLAYNNNFGDHHVDALLLAETRDYHTNNIGAYGYGLDFIELDELDKISNLTFSGEQKNPSVSGSSSGSRVAGFAGRFNYNFADRYFLEASVRRDGSYLFGGMNKRWVTLPGISIGWRIDRENFFKADFVQMLKIRAGFGQTATSGISPFQWRNTMGLNKNGVVIGGASNPFISASVLGNPYLTWSKCDNYNVGFDANLWNGLLGAEFDVFYKYAYDQLTGATGAYPPSMGGYYFSAANVNKSDYKGFDLTLTHANKIGKFSYGVKLIWSYAYGRYLFVASDSDNSPEYQRLTGKQIGAKLGFIANGFYQTQEEIDNAPYPEISTTRSVLLGNIKYIDRDGDGKITYDGDMGYVGKSNMPTHSGSLNLYGNWNGFDFDVLFSWGLGHEVAMTGVYTATGSEGYMDHTSYTLPFKWYGNSPTYVVENSWTPENPNSELPRLCATPQNNNDAYASTFWYKNGNYLRMKSAQIGYTIPEKLVKKAGITRLRIFAEGYNLFTVSGLSKFNIDPESPAVNNGYYPQQRKFSFGLNLSF